MKPIKLELCGLNSYSKKNEIDFEKLTEKGLFGIFGNTGSGKSTILDAITIAMYGYIPQNTKDYININSDKASVLYEFEMGNENAKRRYRINRSIGIVEEGIKNYRAVLTELYNDGRENILSESVTDVNSKIVQIMGLTAEDFTKAVVLPQGKFNQFLCLKGLERRNMLERIFNLEEYGSNLILKVLKLKDEQEQKLNDISLILKQYEGVNEGLYNKTKDSLYKLKELELEKSKQLEYSIQTHQENKEIYEKQNKLEKYEARKKELYVKKDDMVNKKRQLENALKSNNINPHIQTLQNLEKTLKEDEFKLEFTQKKLNILNQELIIAINKYDEAYKIKNEKLPKLSEEKIKLERARELEEELINIDNDIKEIKVKCNMLNEEKQALEKNNIDIHAQLEVAIKSLREIEENIDKLKIGAELKYKIHLAYEYEKEQKRLSEEENIKKLKLDRLVTELEKINLKAKYIEKNKNLISAKLENAIEEKSVILSKSPGKYGEVLNKTEYVANLKNKLYIAKENEVKKETIQRELNNILESKYKGEREIKIIQEKLENKQRNILELKKDLDKLKYLNLATELRKELKYNTPCPVCNSRHYENIDTLKPDDKISFVSKNIEKAYTEEHGLKLELDELLSNHTMIICIEKNKKKEIEQVKSRLGEIKYNEIFNKLKDEERKLEVLKNNISRWEKEKQEVETKCSELKEENNKISLESVKINTILNNYTQYNKELKLELDNLQLKIKEVKDTYLGLKSSIKISNISSKVDEINKNEIVIEELSSNYFKVKNNRDIIDEKLKKYENQLHQIELQLIKNDEIYSQKRRVREKTYNNIILITKGESSTSLLKNLQNDITRILTNEEIYKKKLENERIQQEKHLSDKYNIEGRLKIAKDEYLMKSGVLNQLLIDNKFENIYEVKKAILEPDYIRILHDEITEFEEAEKILNIKTREIKESLGGRRINKDIFAEVKGSIYNLKLEIGRISKEIGAKSNTLNSLKSTIDKVNELNKEYNLLNNKVSMLKELYKVLEENKFVEFIAKNKLINISKEATNKLQEMTNGRYSLEVDSSSKFVIRDNLNGGKLRAIDTLSGGEMFLTSLALAISLSNDIQLKGSLPLELLFIDEGFGYLDNESLEKIIESICRLDNKNLNIGIISHMEELKNRVPVKLLVEGNVLGESSAVRIEYS